jgi:antirestriction protein ArdC
MAGWYRVVKTIKGHRYLYEQRTWRDGRQVRTQSRYIGRAGDTATAGASPGQAVEAGLSDTKLKTIRYKGWAADKKAFATEQEAEQFLKTYDFKGLSNSVAEDYKGSSFDPFRHTAQQPGGDQKALAKQSPRRDIYSSITDNIIKDLERGVRPWDKPWKDGVPRIPLRHNGEPYRGVNILILWLTAVERGYSSPNWMTFQQANELGGGVRKGEKGTHITYTSTLKRVKLDNDGNPVFDDKGYELIEEVHFLKGYTVFNVEQIDGLPDKYHSTPPSPLNQADRIKLADALAAATGADIRHGGDRAYNSLEGNYVQMPPYPTFRDPESYAATLMHELVHWTRHPDRLGREFGRERWGDEGYAMEELVAEIGAAFLCAEFGIAPKTREEHSSYIASWLEVLRNDKQAIFNAAAHAQRAVDFIHTVPDIER